MLEKLQKQNRSGRKQQRADSNEIKDIIKVNLNSKSRPEKIIFLKLAFFNSLTISNTLLTQRYSDKCITQKPGKTGSKSMYKQTEKK